MRYCTYAFEWRLFALQSPGQVFLKIARDAEIESGQNNTNHQSWQLPNGQELLIAAGLERISLAAPQGSLSGGQEDMEVYNVQWTTDEQGQLRIYAVTRAE